MNNSPIKVKTFLEYLSLVHSEPKRAKKYLEDRRLTSGEKKILQAWFDLKNCLHEEIIQDLSSLTCENELVECQRKLIVGLAQNNKAEFKYALLNLKSSLEILEKYPLKDHLFICLYNLFIVSFNLGDENEIKDSFKLLDALKNNGLNPRQEICFNQCELNYNNFFENFDEAKEQIEKLDAVKKEMTEPVIMSYLISKFIYFLKQSKFESCQNILGEMKDYRLFRYSPNFKFMKMTLEHLQFNRPLYVYEKDFKGAPHLFEQLKVIQKLEEQNVTEAKKHWANLQKNHPEMYQENFKFNAQKNLFSLCLEKYKYNQSEEKESTIDKSHGKNNAEVLISILSASKTPIPKEIIFQKIWGHRPKDKADDDRLKNLIYYVKKTKGLHIAYRKGCYQLIENTENVA